MVVFANEIIEFLTLFFFFFNCDNTTTEIFKNVGRWREMERKEVFVGV